MKLPDICYLEGEPYEKYMELSKSENYQIILDIGTYKGHSAFAFAVNKTNIVKTFDIENQIEIDLPDNVEFIKQSYSDIDLETINEANIILLDVDPHDGEQEKEFMGKMAKSNFKGLLIIDDINLFEEMREFWKSIKQNKREVSWHHSGTGLVYFND
jgi:hypothetical protein